MSLLNFAKNNNAYNGMSSWFDFDQTELMLSVFIKTNARKTGIVGANQ